MISVGGSEGNGHPAPIKSGIYCVSASRNLPSKTGWAEYGQIGEGGLLDSAARWLFCHEQAHCIRSDLSAWDLSPVRLKHCHGDYVIELRNKAGGWYFERL